MAQIQVALQVYTVRELLKNDYVGTLKKVRDIGYEVVELAGSGPFDAPGMRKALDDVGLSATGIHVALEQLETNLLHWLEFCRVVGIPNLVCPWLPQARRQTKEDWLGVAASLEKLGARCKEEGLRLLYHNHNFEFVRVDGSYALDLIYAKTAADHVYAEIDTYWVQHGGADPVAYVRKYARRLPILHVKDMAADEKRSFAEVGRGILDWPAIHKASLKAGVEVYCVEQDICPGDPLESARISYEFLQQLRDS
jgi:sugar phosphate isomerase/epimerase